MWAAHLETEGGDPWPIVELVTGCAAILYSTHSYKEAKYTRVENEPRRALLTFENQFGALSAACRKPEIIFSEKHVEIFVEEQVE